MNVGVNKMESIKINLGVWNGVFAVPNCIVDEHIKLAGAAQLKVLMYILRHSGQQLSPEEVGAALSMHPADVRDSVNFWVSCGLLKCEQSTLVPSEVNVEVVQTTQVEPTKEIAQEQKPTRPTTRVRRPDGPYIAQRIMQDEEFAFLTEEAQSIIGKPLSTGDLGVLLNLHDMDGLPFEVIIMLLQFCVGRGKFGMKYIESVGMAWAQQGVDSVAKAEEKIKEFSKQRDAWGLVSSVFGLKNVGSPTKTQLETANRWINDWGFKRDAIRLAYETCVDNKGEYSLRYIDGIIKKWQKSGVHTVKEIEQLKLSEPQQTKDKKRKTSYDISQIESFDEFK